MKKIYWKAEEFKYQEKSADWYWILWSISSLIIFTLYYFFQDYVFGLLIFLLTVIITMASFKRPSVKKYAISDSEIILESDKQTIPFSEIISYNIDYNNMKIIIYTKKKVQPLIYIPFEANQNIRKIDTFLAKKIKKDEKLEIPFLELLLNIILGF